MDDFTNGTQPNTADGGQAYGLRDNLRNENTGFGDSANAAPNWRNSAYPAPGYGDVPSGSVNPAPGYGYAPADSANAASGGAFSDTPAAIKANDPDNYGRNGYEPYGGTGYGQPPRREEPQKKSNVAAIVCLVFGILSLICCWTIVLPFVFGLVSLICGIVAAVKKQNKVLWILGLILAVVGIGITIAMMASILPVIRDLYDLAMRNGGEVTQQDIERILSQYGISINY